MECREKWNYLMRYYRLLDEVEHEKWYSMLNLTSDYCLLLLLPLLSCVFLISSHLFWRRERKILPAPSRWKDSTLSSPTNDWRRVSAEKSADPVRFPLAFINSPLACIQCLVQPTESLKLALCILHRAWKPEPSLLVGRDRLQTHYFEPRTILFLQSWYIATQPVPDLFVLAHQNEHPFISVGPDELGMNPSSASPSTSPPISKWMSMNFSFETCTFG